MVVQTSWIRVRAVVCPNMLEIIATFRNIATIVADLVLANLPKSARRAEALVFIHQAD